MLDEFRSRTRNDYAWAFRSSFHASNHYTHTLADSKRFKPRLLLARHASFRLTDVEDHIWPFDTLHRRVDNLSDTPDVFVVDRVSLGFANLLKDHLFRELSGDATENPVDLLGNQQFSADLKVRIQAVGIFQRDLQVGIFDLLRRLYDGLHREGADLAAVFVELRAEVLLRFVVLARRHDNGVFHRADHNLRVDSLFPTYTFDDVVKLASHKNQLLVASNQLPVNRFRCPDRDKA